jgi:hypothetical protein
MIFGAHFLFYSTNPEADRAFLRDGLGFPFVDSGEGWLIFALPPAEAGVHPSDDRFSQEHAGRPMIGAVIYLMCDHLETEIKSLEARNVKCSKIEHDDWGMSASIPLPSGAHIGLYQPTHPIALKLGAK